MKLNQRAINRLREEVKPGETLHTILRHVSKSGMTRDIDVIKVECVDGKPQTWWLSGMVAATGLFRRYGRNDALRVGGTGMDMGFHVVYEVSRMLYPSGFGCIGEGCPSNDHFNGDRDYTPHTAETIADENGKRWGGVDHWHNEGGYALRHHWL